MKKAIVLAAAIASLGSTHANLKDAKPAGKFGEWRVLQSVDKMTDKIDCTGVYGSGFETQLSSDAMYIRVSGGIQSVTLRYGDDPARPMRLASKLEKDGRMVLLENDEFRSAVHSNRLRIQVLTLVSGVKDFDLDTSGVDEAIKHINNSCPIIEEKVVDSSVSPIKGKVSDSPDICSSEIVNRMKLQKIPAAKISAICSK
ncbi:hypothetical protein [Delftia tsuruhatensis]|uniref:hypothetical protein n=1 Tax=Delftia tsuruhatensis TaxID=180282 RepID=UPI0031D5FF9F